MTNHPPTLRLDVAGRRRQMARTDHFQPKAKDAVFLARALVLYCCCRAFLLFGSFLAVHHVCARAHFSALSQSVTKTSTNKIEETSSKKNLSKQAGSGNIPANSVISSKNTHRKCENSVVFSMC